MNSNDTGRNSELDGIRGWAAISVLLFHFFAETFGIIFPFLKTGAFRFISDGYLAILIFFILSGDALSSSFFHTKSTASTVRLVLTRYFRLVFPIFISCLFVYILMKLNWTFNKEAATVVQRESWLGAFITFPADFYKCIKYSFFEVFFYNTTELSYNPFFWTMSIELIGSFIVFINIFIFSTIKKPIIVLVAQLLFFIWVDSWYSLFILGMLLGYFRSSGVIEKIESKKYLSAIIIIVFFSIILLNKLYNNLFGSNYFFTYFLKASGIVIIIYCTPILKSFFKSKVSLFLGDISFPLYAIHFSVLISFTSWFILKAHEQGTLHNSKNLWIPFCSILLCILLAFFFRKIEKVFLERMNNGIKKRILKS
jgi:peptidoglycan/LPS O-acetylase OafA/YrhL